MRKIISLILLSVFANLALLSVGNGQSSVGVQGYVPETDLNKNSNKVQIILDENKPVFKENKYLYFFEKALGLQSDSQKNIADPEENQTPYDQLASAAILWIILLILAIILWLIIGFIDHQISKHCQWRASLKKNFKAKATR